RQGTDNGPPDARVVRRVVEHEARRVMLVGWRALAELRRNRRLLVGAERAPVTVDAVEIRMPGQKPRAIRAAVYRILLAQHPVGREGIRVELGAQMGRVEGQHASGFRRRERLRRLDYVRFLP